MTPRRLITPTAARRTLRRAAVAVLGFGLATPLVACSGSSTTPGNRTLTVLAAASLTGSFDELARRFEQSHPGVTVTLVFGGSSALEQQVVAGAPADVFASAATRNMDQLAAAGRAQAPVTFARNRLVIAVPKGNPAKVTGVASLPHLKVAVCQAAVPCGAAAQKLFTAAHVSVTPVTQEADVKAVLTKVTLGEVDAGLVYATDVQASGGKADAVATSPTVTTDYPITVVRNAPDAGDAQAFVDLVTSAEGRRVLSDAGFLTPPFGASSKPS